jgi:putative transposase
VNNNPVHHGLVPVATQYPFCSAGIYELEALSALRRKLQSYKFDAVKVVDDFEPLMIET